MENKNTFSILNKKSKWLGIIDYKSLIILLIYLYILWNVFGFFINSVLYKVYFIIIFSIPILGLFYSYRGTDDIFEVVWTIIKFAFSPKIYAQKIENQNSLERCCKL